MTEKIKARKSLGRPRMAEEDKRIGLSIRLPGYLILHLQEKDNISRYIQSLIEQDIRTTYAYPSEE